MAQQTKTEINKDEFIKIISERADFTQLDVRDIFDTMIAFLEECAHNGTPLSIRGFGRITYNSIAGYKGTHPTTGEEIEVPASVRVGFRLAENIRNAHRDATEE